VLEIGRRYRYRRGARREALILKMGGEPDNPWYTVEEYVDGKPACRFDQMGHALVPQLHTEGDINVQTSMFR